MSDGKLIPFNPLDKRHLGESVGQAMLRQPAVAMESLSPFDGAGIYAIYYTGNFEAYRKISTLNRNNSFKVPIYVGKAVPKGSRKGSIQEVNPGKVLFNRIKQHIRSIEQATNLKISDFHCRYLIVDDIWIPLGESLLIASFSPLWNKLVDGFGNHDPGQGRYKGVCPRWDVLHPGRPWAARLKPRKETADQIIREIIDYLHNNPPSGNNNLLMV